MTVNPVKIIDVRNGILVSIATSLYAFTLKSPNPKITNDVKDKFNECILKTTSGIASPLMEKFTKFLDEHSDIMEYKDASRIIEQLDKFEKGDGKTPAKGFVLSDIMRTWFITSFETFPRFVDFYAQPRTTSAIACSYFLEDYNKIASVINSGFKPIKTPKDNLYDILNDIVTFVNGTGTIPIVKCSMPIIEILMAIKKQNGFTEDQNQKAITLIKFIMTVENVSGNRKERNADLQDFIKNHFPFRRFEGLSETMFGFKIIDSNTDSHIKASSGRISGDRFRRHNLVIFEIVLLACFLMDFQTNPSSGTNLEETSRTDLEEDRNMYSKVVKCLNFIAESDDIETSLSVVLPTTLRFIAYVSEFSFIDSISGFNCLHFNYVESTYQWPDLYGITENKLYGMNYASHSPRVTVTNENIKKYVWSFGSIDGFEKVVFDNNLDEIVWNDPEKQGKVIITTAHCFTTIIDAIGTLPKVFNSMRNANNNPQFVDILHVLLKLLIAAPSNFLPKELVNGKYGGYGQNTSTFKLTPVQNEMLPERIIKPDQFGVIFVKLIRVNDTLVYQ